MVLLLFTIALAAASGYQVVRTEFDLATQSMEGMQALSVARAGLKRFVAEQIGVVGDSVAYAIGGGIATITTRKLAAEDSLNHLYLVRSEGKVTDPRYPDNPARRVVGMYARHHLRPVNHVAAVVSTGSRVYFRDGADAYGWDQADTADCAGGGTVGVAGAATTDNTYARGGSVVAGNPDEIALAGYQSVYDTVGVRWDVLSDPDFPVEFEGSPPDYEDLPADSFPVVRRQGDLTAGSSWAGRGVLIVTGELYMSSGFSWEGIILAGELSSQWWSWPVVRGTLIGGLNAPNPNVQYRFGGDFRYNSCHVYAANESLSYLEALDDTLWEEY